MTTARRRYRSNRRRRRRPATRRTWLGRLALLLVGLEIALHIPPLPPWWEAGIWSGNILSERASVQLRALWNEGHLRHAYRDHPWEPLGGKARLVAMGDSRVYGHYVKPHDAFPQVMDARGTWDVANMGLPGASVVEALDFIVEDALALRPQAAVVCYDINSSLFGVMSREQAGSRSNWPVQLARSSALIRWTELGVRALLVDRHPVMTELRYRDLMVELLDRLEAGGVQERLVLVGWTELEEFPHLFTTERYQRFRQASREAAAATGARTLEMEAVYANVDPESVFVGAERMHLSPWAHQRMADAVEQALGAPP